MKKTLKFTFLLLLIALLSACSLQAEQKSQIEQWTYGPFVKSEQPVLTLNKDSSFLCPVRGSRINWEAKDVFNPAAVVRDGRVWLLYRAEDTVGRFAGTSRIGLATSEDGIHFTRRPEPVMYPDQDAIQIFEWEGGCEDPRIVEDESGTYYMTYTAYNGQKARLFIATSRDLVNWKKHGSVFLKAFNGKYVNVWSKSGSIVCCNKGDKYIATKINGKYWMYWGESNIYLAHSENLIDWTPVEYKEGVFLQNASGYAADKRRLRPVLLPRKDKFDSVLVEPGPQAILTEQGIVLIYNSKNSGADKTLPPGTYAAGQVLFDKKNPSKIQERTDTYFIKPEKDYEIIGQVGNVCFVEGLVYFKGKYYLYYGTADSKIAVAVYDPGKN